jgi:hypothetical protein
VAERHRTELEDMRLADCPLGTVEGLLNPCPASEGTLVRNLAACTPVTDLSGVAWLRERRIDDTANTTSQAMRA